MNVYIANVIARWQHKYKTASKLLVSKYPLEDQLCHCVVYAKSSPICEVIKTCETQCGIVKGRTPQWASTWLIQPLYHNTSCYQPTNDEQHQLR